HDSMNNVTGLKSSDLRQYRSEQLLIDTTVKYIDLNKNQTSISFIIDKSNTEQPSRQAYIYQSTLKNLLNRCAKHELLLNREPTYYFHIPTRSYTLPMHLSRTELRLHSRSATIPRYNNKFEMIIHVTDSQSISEREDSMYDVNRRKSTRYRMYTSLPRTKHALLYYPQPGSPGIILDSSTIENKRQSSNFSTGEFQFRIENMFWAMHIAFKHLAY
ncbi:hypothetical protein EWB00_007910, partial [Schistosoma japonicum]